MSCEAVGVDPHTNKAYFDWLADWAFTHSDGCTGVADVYLFCCWAHDYGYQTGEDPYEAFQSRKTAQDRGCSNTKLRWCIESESKLGRLNPVSWVRYWGVSIFGRFFYKPKVTK